MDPEVTATYNLIYNSTYCVGAQTKQLYLLFFKGLVEKYLNDTHTNYNIYVSAHDSFLPLYHNLWPAHNKLNYVADGFVPTTVPANLNCIYFYHQKSKPSKDEQSNLVTYLENNPSIKYVYVGPVTNLTLFVFYKLFKYYLHFEKRPTRWGGLNAGRIINYSISRSVCRKYYSQQQKKKKVVNPIFLYDYYILHDVINDKTTLNKFNKIKFTPKKKKTPKPKKNTNNTNPQNDNTDNSVPKIKYIYTDSHSSTFLIMPDGSKENYKNIVDKYHDIIEI